MEISITIVEVIQAMLAPGIMISACGLLIMGVNNKYSTVVNRIRLLNAEKRKYFDRAAHNDFRFEEEVRLKSISTQILELSKRVKLVRNAIFCYSLAVGSFVLTSLIIGLGFALQTSKIAAFSMFVFLFGMVGVLVGVTFAALEVLRGYQIVQYEIKADE